MKERQAVAEETPTTKEGTTAGAPRAGGTPRCVLGFHGNQRREDGRLVVTPLRGTRL